MGNSNEGKNTFLIEEYVIAIIVLVMFVLVVLNVLTRYVISYSLAFTEELVTYLFVCASMFGAPVACVRGANIGMDAVVKLLPKSWRIASIWISVGMSYFIYGMIGYYGFRSVMMQINNKAITPIMDIPIWIFTLSLPLGSLLYFFRVTQWGVEKVKNIKNDEVVI